MESGTLNIFTEQRQLPALDHLPPSRHLCETEVNFYLVWSTVCGCLYNCGLRQHEVCFIILEFGNFPADRTFISSSISQLLHYGLCHSNVISPFFTMKNSSPNSIIIDSLSPIHSDSFSFNPFSSPRISYLIKNLMIKYNFKRHSLRKFEVSDFCLTL